MSPGPTMLVQAQEECPQVTKLWTTGPKTGRERPHRERRESVSHHCTLPHLRVSQHLPCTQHPSRTPPLRFVPCSPPHIAAPRVHSGSEAPPAHANAGGASLGSAGAAEQAGRQNTGKACLLGRQVQGVAQRESTAHSLSLWTGCSYTRGQVGKQEPASQPGRQPASQPPASLPAGGGLLVALLPHSHAIQNTQLGLAHTPAPFCVDNLLCFLTFMSQPVSPNAFLAEVGLQYCWREGSAATAAFTAASTAAASEGIGTGRNIISSLSWQRPE